MRDSSGLALGTGSSADNVNYGDPKELEHASADPRTLINPPLKGFTAETPKVARRGSLACTHALTHALQNTRQSPAATLASVAASEFYRP